MSLLHKIIITLPYTIFLIKNNYFSAIPRTNIIIRQQIKKKNVINDIEDYRSCVGHIVINVHFNIFVIKIATAH